MLLDTKILNEHPGRITTLAILVNKSFITLIIFNQWNCLFDIRVITSELAWQCLCNNLHEYHVYLVYNKY